jgi:cold shock protein
MKKFRVQFVKYDMSKTKNRKRKDMLVDSKSDKSVKTQLERIHKGEQVVMIHEIIWDEEQIKEVLRHDQSVGDQYFYGTVKFFDADKGFGFIVPEEDMEDLFFHQSACKEGVPGDRDRVEFKVSQGLKGVAAIHVRIIS